jgi:hypothetical protein
MAKARRTRRSEEEILDDSLAKVEAIEKSGKTVDEFLKDSGISDNSDEAGSNDSAE